LYWNGEEQKELEKQVEKDLGTKLNGNDKQEAVLENTRLAMTSRTAFFNGKLTISSLGVRSKLTLSLVLRLDRIISPPMVCLAALLLVEADTEYFSSALKCRAMALLYIGPLNSPDLHSDYHISPIFTPPHLLHQFPPVYLSCGERDPFVDDTVIFAGKLREAKEARKLELLGKELRHGESLRMSSGSTKEKARDPILDEDEEDWVQSSIIEGWSHGYLQMVALLPAAEKVISMMGNWIEDAFEKDTLKKERYGTGVRTSSTNSTSTVVSALPKTQVTPPTSKPLKSASPSTAIDNSTLHPSGSAVVDSGSDDEEEVLSFTPRNRRGSSNVSRTASPSPAYPAVRVASNPTSPTRNSFPTSRSPPEHPHSIHAHLVTPVERALSDEYHSTSASSSKHFPPSASPDIPRPASTSPSAGAPLARAISDETRPSSVPPPLNLDDAVKKGRSGSAGSLPPPMGAQFVDAKHLLRRRRDDLVSGLSANNSRVASRDGSDEETNH
jgi:hypothetical protein